MKQPFQHYHLQSSKNLQRREKCCSERKIEHNQITNYLTPSVLRTSRHFLVGIDHRKRVGWIALYSKNGWQIWTKSLNKKNALIIDNIPAYPIIDSLLHEKLVFLPPNTTSMFQMVDQGVRKCFKFNYRKGLVKLMLLSLDSNKSLKQVPLTALQLPVSAWKQVSQKPSSIVFRKLKYLREIKQLQWMMRTISFKEFNDDLNEMSYEKKIQLCWQKTRQQKILKVLAMQW